MEISSKYHHPKFGPVGSDMPLLKVLFFFWQSAKQKLFPFIRGISLQSSIMMFHLNFFNTTSYFILITWLNSSHVLSNINIFAMQDSWLACCMNTADYIDPYITCIDQKVVTLTFPLQCQTKEKKKTQNKPVS